MSKKPANNDAELISQAVQFDATIFLGVGQYHSASFDKLEDARKAAAEFSKVANNGRRGMVYAITAAGRSTLVPDSYQPTSHDEGLKDMTANFTAIEIAKLTAVLTGGGYKRANSKDAATKRFLSVAAGKGVQQSAERILATSDMDFDTAQHVLFEAIKGGPASIPEVKAATVETGEPVAISRKVGGKVAKIAKLKGEPAPKVERTKAAPKSKEPGKRAATLAAAQAGTIPTAPDFSAETHKRFRPKLAQVVALIEAKDIAGLKAFEINPVSSSPKAIAKYRDLAVIALEARAAQEKAA